MSHKALISAEIAKRQSKRALKFLNEHGLEVPLSFVQEMTAFQWGFSFNFISILEAQFVGLDCIFEPSEHCSHGVGDKSFKDQAPEPLKDNVYHAISAARRSTLACEDLVASKTR